MTAYKCWDASGLVFKGVEDLACPLIKGEPRVSFLRLWRLAKSQMRRKQGAPHVPLPKGHKVPDTFLWIAPEAPGASSRDIRDLRRYSCK